MLLAVVVPEVLLQNQDFGSWLAMPFVAWSMLSSEGCVALLGAQCNLVVRREEVIF